MSMRTDDNFLSLIKTASDALAVRNYQRCHEHCIAAIKIDPKAGEPYFLLSVLTSDHGNFAKALEIADKSILCGGNKPNYLAQRAKCLTALHRHDEAAVDAMQSTGQNPTDTFTLDTLGVVLSRIGEHSKAVPLFKKASDNEPEKAEYKYNLGSSLQFAGRFSEAEAAYRAAIACAPNFHKAYYGLVSLSKQRKEENLLGKMVPLFDKCVDPDDRLHLGHAIAKTYEDIGEYETALRYLFVAKKAKRESLKYTFAQDRVLFEAARDVAPKLSWLPDATGHGPIFVFGMPRTGTTLVDRILSSHSKIASVGELTHFGLILKELTRSSSQFVLDPETLRRAVTTDLNAAGAKYIQQTDRLRGASDYFVDKMPLNFFYAPLILAAIPNAKLICLRRHPIDTCLSNFRQLFRTSYSYYNYSYNLEDIGRYYKHFSDLIDYWGKTLPSTRFMEIQYEDIVADQEQETRRLLAFCGVAFEAACLDFHKNEAPIATASSVQVRNPIYSSSIGRWKKYGGGLKPLIDLLDSADADL